METEIRTIPTDKWLTIVMKSEDIELWLTDLGASILRLYVKDRKGNWQDVVLGYETLDDYPKYQAYLGATVGRTANRIARGQFVLNGKLFQLPINNGPNCNHGGEGFSFRTFSTCIGKDEVIFYIASPDKDQGYPGSLMLMVKYQLAKDTVIISYTAVSDADTLCSITNHSYFNLDGKPGNIGNHRLQMKASRYAPVDEDGLVTGEIRTVSGTPFDFQDEKEIREALESHHPQIRTAKGLDHPFLLDQTEKQAILYSPETGIEMTVSTTLPCMQLYTANWFNGEPGKEGTRLNQYDGIAIETEYMPDAINLDPGNAPVILRKGEVWEAETSFQFKVR